MINKGNKRILKLVHLLNLVVLFLTVLMLGIKVKASNFVLDNNEFTLDLNVTQEVLIHVMDYSAESTYVIKCDNAVTTKESDYCFKVTIKEPMDVYGEIFEITSGTITGSQYFYIKATNGLPKLTIAYEKGDGINGLEEYFLYAQLENYETEGYPYIYYYVNDICISVNESFSLTVDPNKEYKVYAELRDTENNSILKSEPLLFGKESKKEKVLSLNVEDTINLLSNSDYFKILAYIDTISDASYEYFWSIDGDSLTVLPSNYNYLLVKPNKLGQTKITLVVNLGEGKAISKVVTINVVEISDDVNIITDKNEYKKGESATVQLQIGENSNIYNIETQWQVTKDGEKEDFKLINDSKIVINDLTKGKYEVTAIINGQTYTYRFKIFNVILDRLLGGTFSFVLIAAAVCLLVFVIRRKRETPLNRATRLSKNCAEKLNKLDLDLDKIEDEKKRFNRLKYDLIAVKMKIVDIRTDIMIINLDESGQVQDVVDEYDILINMLVAGIKSIQTMSSSTIHVYLNRIEQYINVKLMDILKERIRSVEKNNKKKSDDVLEVKPIKKEKKDYQKDLDDILSDDKNEE